jgi:hypothetical protein
MKPDRLDRVMRDLEVLQNDADGIIDCYGGIGNQT